MADWLTYSLSDFIPFAPSTYARLFQTYHAEIWPLWAVGLLVGLVTVWLLAGGRARWAAALLGICWLWTGWAFLIERYQTLNWAGLQMGLFYMAAGVVIAAAGLGAVGRKTRAGAALALLATLGHPLIVGADGLPWDGGGLVGTAPDPTALATLGLALATAGWRRFAIALPAALWCALGVLAAVGMERPALGGAAAAGIILFAVFSVWPAGRRGLG